MNRFLTLVFLLTLSTMTALAQGNVDNVDKKEKIGDFLKNQNLNLEYKFKPRQWQYRPEGQDFVCVNGENRYTRALYGSHDEERIDTSDRPVFMIYKAKDSRNLHFTVKMSGYTIALDSTDYCEARYTPGKRTYTLKDHHWGDGVITLTVLAFPERPGGIFRFHVSGFKKSSAIKGAKARKRKKDSPAKVEIRGIMCDIANLNLNRWGDMAAEKPGSLEADPNKEDFETQSIRILGEGTRYFTVQKQHLSICDVTKSGMVYWAEVFDAAEKYREELASQVVIRTPDPFINTLGGVLTTAADGTWDDKTGTVFHGAIGWHIPLPGWRGAYAMDFLGWFDRAKRHFDAYAESQVTKVPYNTIPQPITSKGKKSRKKSGKEVTYATPDSANNLCRAKHEWGNSIYSNGYICRSPHNNTQMHHYDMNLNYIDELLWHFCFDADTAYLRKMWPVIKRHLAWEKQAFDGDGDGLYDAYAAIWASDGLYYNGGGVTHSSAYNYRSNRMAARIAEILGESPIPYRTEAEHILKAMNSMLWSPTTPQGGVLNRETAYGHWAEFVDLMGLKRKHESAALWSVYTPIDSHACTPEQAYQATQWVDNNTPHIPITIKNEGPGWNEGNRELENQGKQGFYTMSTTNWMPYCWSTNNVAFAEVMHTALAYFLAGRADEGYKIMKGNLLDEMYLGHSPANLGQVSTYDAARGEIYRDFADNIGVTAKCVIEGLFGIQPDALNGKLYIRPGFPSEWDSAYVKTPYIEMSYHRIDGKKYFDIKQNFPQKLEVVIDTIGIKELTGVKTNVETCLNKSTLFKEVNSSQCHPVNISKSFNANLTDIFKNEYTSPASPYNTLRIPKNGFGEWCHPLIYAETNDSVFRNLVKNGIYTAKLEGGEVIPFSSVAVGRNIIYTSLWDNYPDQVKIKLKGQASHAYLLLAGTTNQMQSRIANGVIIVKYTDGTEENLELVNPNNWCPIEQDYYVDEYAFKVEKPRPYRVHLMSGKVSCDLGKELGIKGVYGREIKGGAAEILDMPLNPQKKLKSLTIRTLSNDVVIGLMAVTLQ